MSVNVVKPERVSGARDFLPGDAILQRDLFAKVARVYESFGFVPIDTPCLERWGVLTGNEADFDKSIFRTKVVRGAEDRKLTDEDLGEGDTALRFDLTVPLARFVSAHTDLPRPFKRYQIGKVFRGESAQAGRYREFTQFDFDTIGSSSVLADVEVIQVIHALMTTLGVKRFDIRFNSRRVLNGFAGVVGCEAKAAEFFRIMDKVDKLEIDGVCEQLRRKPDNEFDETALALGDEQIALVTEFLQQDKSNAEQTLSYLKNLGKTDANQSLVEGIAELETMVDRLRHLGIPQDQWSLDLSVARGLGYYNGPVFEAHLVDAPKLGAVIGGGRFDGLTNRFIPNSNISGTGASLGVDRMIMGLQQLGLVEQADTVSQVLVTIFSAELEKESLFISQEIRAAGFSVELYMGEDSSLKGQLAYATKQGIPFVIIMGPDEAQSGVVQLKDMKARKQESLTPTACIDTLRRVLS